MGFSPTGRPALDRTGTKYGMLTAIRRVSNTENGNTRWLCLCECGNEKVIRATHLVSGNTTSCGCGRIKGSGNPALNFLLADYRCGARKRNLEWKISDIEFWNIVSSCCNYCGAPPKNIKVSNSHTFIFSGVDRIDSRKGYISGNVVPCCSTCNYGKRDLSIDEWEKYLDHLVKFRTVKDGQ